MKNYYDILGLSSYEDSQDVILGKYREVTTQLRAHVLDKDMSQQLIDVNEAFLVLSDRELKKKYDYTLSSNSENEELLRECLNLNQIKHYKHNKPSIRVFVEENRLVCIKSASIRHI